MLVELVVLGLVVTAGVVVYKLKTSGKAVTGSSVVAGVEADVKADVAAVKADVKKNL